MATGRSLGGLKWDEGQLAVQSARRPRSEGSWRLHPSGQAVAGGLPQRAWEGWPASHIMKTGSC